MIEKDLERHIEGCRRGERTCQHRVYTHFYGYALSVCSRYASNIEEAKEVLNDAFFKIFTKIDRYNPEFSFKGWLHRIVVNTAIDRYRSRQNQPNIEEISYAHSVEAETDVVENLTREEIFAMVQRLTPAYRTVFNLYVVEGYSHAEIADLLQITEGASKSNLSKARSKLKSMLLANTNEIGWKLRPAI
ncbi:MAG: RNA polymerase sigma factor [Saprospiraceae bacterium]|nr:RNA polymerase sigma factor [Saprospiraceae bacterium]